METTWLTGKQEFAHFVSFSEGDEARDKARLKTFQI